MRRLFTRLVAFVTRPSDARLRQEIEEHIELETADNIRAGLPPVEARRQALLKFGSVESIRGQYRDEQTLPMLELLAQDTRYALRQLRRAPAFALTAVLTLALGIGVNTAMFTVIHGVLLTDLPYPDSARLLRLVQAHNTGDVTMAEYQFVQAHGRALASVAAYRGAGERRIAAPQDQIWIPTLFVSTHFLRTLGVQPQLGREFTEDDTAPGGPASVIVSDDVWRRVFGSDPAIIGRSIPLGAASATVIGVLPPGFWFPQPVSALLPLQPTGSLSDTGTNTQLIARLAPGVGITQAQAELSAMTEQLRDAARGRLAGQYRGLAAMPLRDWLVGDVRLNLLLLFAATGVLLLIACGNLALLLLARFAARTREVAVRAALGSSRARLLTQFLTENVIVTAFGAAAGVAAAHALVRVFLAASPFDLPASAPIAVSPIALLFTVLSALATAVFVTWAPFLGTARLNVPACLRTENKNVGAGVIRARTRNAFIVGEVALSTVLLVAAGLLVQTLYRTNSEHLGFVPEQVLTFQTPLAPERARNAHDRVAFTRALLERLQRTPGVAAAAATNLLPLMGQSNLPTERDGHPDRSIGGMEVRAVTADYFAVMGMPLLRGRPLGAGDIDGDAPVVLINDSVARRWWPDGDALGDRLTIGRFQGKVLMNDVSRQVVGIVGDTKTRSLQAAARPTVYVPLAAGFSSSAISWVLKTDGSRGLVDRVRAAVREIDLTQRVTALRSMDDIVAVASARPRFNASLFAMFAAVALSLTIVGLYGVLSFVVSQRRQEIGTRLALGASRGAVVRSVVRQGLWLTTMGLIPGLATAAVASRWLSAMLFGVAPQDVASYAVVAALVVAVGCAASYLPARRAAMVDPLTAMRVE